MNPESIWKKLKNINNLTYEEFLSKYFPYYIWQPAKKRVETTLEYLQGSKILDAGSGTGWFTICLLLQGYNPYSVDISDEAIKESKIILNEIELKYNYYQSSLIDLPFRNSFFDTIVSFDVLEHIDDLDAALIELGRVLKNEGIFIASIPNKFGPYSLIYDRVLNPIKLKFVPEDERIRYYHEHIEGIEWWKRQFVKNNFKIIKIINLEFLTPLIAFLGYKRGNKLAKLDCELSNKISPNIASVWVFILKK